MPDETSDRARHGAAATKKGPRGQVTLFPNWCKGCGLCVGFCPADVLGQEEDGRVVIARPGQCTACRWCELHCPDFAIFVSDVTAGEEG